MLKIIIEINSSGVGVCVCIFMNMFKIKPSDFIITFMMTKCCWFIITYPTLRPLISVFFLSTYYGNIYESFFIKCDMSHSHIMYNNDITIRIYKEYNTHVVKYFARFFIFFCNKHKKQKQKANFNPQFENATHILSYN